MRLVACPEFPIARRIPSWAFVVLALVALGETLVSALRSNQWWIRMLDFPRGIVLVAILLVAIGCAVFVRSQWRWLLVALLFAASGWQFWRLHDYTRLVGAEVAQGDGPAPGDADACFTAVGLNVLQYNRDYALTIAMLRRERPDLVLLMETDKGWADALAPVLAGYGYRLERPLDNTYGMIFASRLPVVAAQMVADTAAHTPTLYATLRTRAGTAFDYVGLHPRPPLPGQDTTKRDANIEHAAQRVADSGRPVVAMGDFNDVAWSHTTQLFRHTGHFLDPRIGRGAYASFPSDYLTIGWPLDQIFFTAGFTFRRLSILKDVHSDHRPLLTRLCLDPGHAQTGPAEANATAVAAVSRPPAHIH